MYVTLHFVHFLFACIRGIFIIYGVACSRLFVNNEVVFIHRFINQRTLHLRLNKISMKVTHKKIKIYRRQLLYA